jgi:FkbM family methyltransferase
MNGPLHVARRAFYAADGPWLRRGLFESLGSRRYSRPALHGMDQELERLLPRDPGLFVEAGAHDGYTQSNTYDLERFLGWRGLLVEAVPELFEKARRRRPASIVKHAALVAPEGDRSEVVVHFGDLSSTLGAPEHAAGGLRNAGRAAYSVEVPGRTLSGLLDEAGLGRPDLIVLDVEGYELSALRGLELDRHAPDLLVVEMLDMRSNRPRFDELLSSHYAFDRPLSEWDALYRRRT